MAVLVCTLLSEEISLPSVTYPFRFEDDELGVMFSFSSRWTDEEAQRLARQTSLKLSGQLGCPVGAGIGSIVTSSLNLNESYKIARGSLHSSPNASSDTARVQQDDSLHRRNIIDEIKAYIDTHYDEQLTLTSIAESFYLHAHYVSLLFKKRTDVTFLHDLTHIRMEHAKRHLVSTDLKVYEISRLVGYEDSNISAKYLNERSA